MSPKHTEDNYQSAEEYQEAANRGDADAQHALGMMYINGQGVSQNDLTAVKWLQKSAEQGHARAQCHLGFMYWAGRGVPQDDRKAVEWYQKAVDQGDALAQYNLGAVYNQGRGVPQDDCKAIEWWAKAAEQGIAEAQYNLGVMHRKGRGIPKDDRKAVEWWTKAAKQGNAHAQEALQNMNVGCKSASKHDNYAEQKIQKISKKSDEDIIEEKSLVQLLSKYEKKKKKNISRQEFRIIDAAKKKLFLLQGSNAFLELGDIDPFIFPAEKSEFYEWLREYAKLLQIIKTLKKQIDTINNNYEEIVSIKREIEKNYDVIIRGISSQKSTLEYQKYTIERSIGHKISSFLGSGGSHEKIKNLDYEIKQLIIKIENIEKDKNNCIFEIKNTYYFENIQMSASIFLAKAEELKYEFHNAKVRSDRLQEQIFTELLSAKKRKEKHDKKQLEKEALNDYALKRIDAPLNVIRQLKETQRVGSECPYCGEQLTEDRHADHIYPVAHGGRSNFKNMVYACSTCNLRKSDLTLNMYIDKYNLVREDIIKRLKTLGKSY